MSGREGVGAGRAPSGWAGRTGEALGAPDEAEVAVGLGVLADGALGDRVGFPGQQAGRASGTGELAEEVFGVDTPPGEQVRLDQLHDRAEDIELDRWSAMLPMRTGREPAYPGSVSITASAPGELPSRA